MVHRLLAPVFVFALIVGASELQGWQEHSHLGDALGTVRFQTSCAPAAASSLTRGVALLHSFGYEEARRAFGDAATRDPRCAMAQWGIAMTWWHPLWVPPSERELSAGRQAATTAVTLGGRTPLERGYIEAISLFYDDREGKSHGARAAAYRERIAQLTKEFPEDTEASVFFALSLVATSSPADPTFANQKQAAAILNRVAKDQPDHPGVIHYLIHAFDYPRLANEALPAARTYAKVAPASPHALHMPTHIFTRLGLWRDSIDGNVASARTARQLVARTHPGAASFDAMHALDYLVYAYLQIDDQPRARAAAAEAAGAKRFDDPNFAAGYAIAAIPARWTLERREWQAAAALQLPAVNLPWEQFRYALAITRFAQAVGSARSGQAEKARPALEALRMIQQQLTAAPVAGPYNWATQVEALHSAAEAWVLRAEGRIDEAVARARVAAELEEKVGKHPVTPGAVLPARELLGDLLLDLERPAEALSAFEASLAESPNRFNSLAGAARAAARLGQNEKARGFYRALLTQAIGQSVRTETREARAFLQTPGSSSRQ